MDVYGSTKDATTGSSAANGDHSKTSHPSVYANNSADDETTSLLLDRNASLSTSVTFIKENDASCWSKLTFGWMAPLMRLGNAKKRLDPEDILHIPLPADCQTDYLIAAFDESWKIELQRAMKGKTSSKEGNANTSSISMKSISNQDAQPSLLRALFRAFGSDFLIGGFVLKFIHDSCMFVGPQVLNRLIRFLGTADAPLSRGLWLTLVVTLSQLCMSFCLRHYFFKCYKFGLKIRTVVVVAVYKKALVLSAGERHTRSLGEITNLMSIDAQRLQELTTYLHAIWYSFWQIGLALFFLWQQL